MSSILVHMDRLEQDTWVTFAKTDAAFPPYHLSRHVDEPQCCYEHGLMLGLVITSFGRAKYF